MLFQTTKRSPCGHIVARVTLDDWSQYLVTVYHHGVQVSAHYRQSRRWAEYDAYQATLQPVTKQSVSSEAMTELSLVPMH